MRLAICCSCLIAWWSPAAADTLYVRGVVAGDAEPQISTHSLQLDASPVASAAGAGGALAGGVRVNGSSSLTAIIGYEAPSLPWRLSIEALIGAPSRLNFEATGRLATDSLANSANVPPLGPRLGYAAMTAPAVTVLVKPVRWESVTLFAGVGASMLLVYDEKVTNSVLTAVADPKLTIQSSLGAVAQTGLEAEVWNSVVVRLDARYIAYRDARATIGNIQVRTSLPELPTVEVGSARVDVSVRVFVFQCGIGVDF